MNSMYLRGLIGLHGLTWVFLDLLGFTYIVTWISVDLLEFTWTYIDLRGVTGFMWTGIVPGMNR